MSMPLPPVFVIVAVPETVTAPPALACSNPTPVPLLIASVPKDLVPAELFCREIPFVPALTVVVPKLTLPVLVETTIPCVAEPTLVDVPKLAATDEPVIEIPSAPAPEMDVAPDTVNVPAIVLRFIAAPPVLAVEVMLAMVAASVPLARLSGRPVPFRVTSLIVRVPRGPAPDMSVPLSPTMRPRIVLPDATPMAIAALVIVGAPAAAGSAGVLGGTVSPAPVTRPTPWPMSFWLFNKVIGPT